MLPPESPTPPGPEQAAAANGQPAAAVSVPPEHVLLPTPLSWRLALAALLVVVFLIAQLGQGAIGLRGQSLCGILFFFGIVAVFSANLRAVNWRTIGWGIVLQAALAALVLMSPAITIGGREYSVNGGLQAAGDAVKSFIACSDKGADVVFGPLANRAVLSERLGPENAFIFAFMALPPILFVSAFFAVLYHFGILQACVRWMAVVMRYLMRTSGAETLSVAANVFMGQTEAPLIVKPYVPRMTNSELFTLMASGMAHISGGMMVVYINYGANPVAVLATCVMACPCSLYLSKLFFPETGRPETSDTHVQHGKSPYVNAIDAAATGTSDGLRLALNVGAMLIVFTAFVALINILLGLVPLGWLAWTGWEIPKGGLSLAFLFGKLFTPVAMLMGVEGRDQARVGELLGYKLSINEHFAYLQLKGLMHAHPDALSPRSLQLAAYALTGFANFASVGIQLGGIGAIAPERRHDLARLGMKALFVGFVATLLNASIAGVMSDLAK